MTAVRLRILQINLLMRHIEIAAENHRMRLLQLLQIPQEIILPGLAVGKPLQLFLRIRDILRDQPVVWILQSDDSSLMVVLLDAHTVSHRQRLLLCEHRRAGVPLLLRVRPVLMITRKSQFRLPFLHLGLLQADGIRLLPLHKGKKSVLIHHGAEAIHVPADIFLHFCTLFFSCVTRMLFPGPAVSRPPYFPS